MRSVRNRMIRCSVMLVLSLLVGCALQSDESVDAHEESFVITLQEGKSFRITPDPEKMQACSSLVFLPERVQPLTEQFERMVTERIALAEKRNPNLDIRDLVFAEVRARDKSGVCLPPMEYKVADYATVEELK